MSRELFLTALGGQPVRISDAIVLLTGDGKERVAPAVRLFEASTAAWLVVSGGHTDPPYSLHADTLRREVIEQGVDPQRIIVDGESMNTRDQAEWVVEAMREREWKDLLLVTSPYHGPRAFLTFLAVLLDLGMEHECRLNLVPLNGWGFGWWEKPDGLDVTRAELFEGELRKCEEYRPDVATWAQGIAYLREWATRK